MRRRNRCQGNEADAGVGINTVPTPALFWPGCPDRDAIRETRFDEANEASGKVRRCSRDDGSLPNWGMRSRRDEHA
jgi:hypothetical protein